MNPEIDIHAPAYLVRLGSEGAAAYDHFLSHMPHYVTESLQLQPPSGGQYTFSLRAFAAIFGPSLRDPGFGRPGRQLFTEIKSLIPAATAPSTGPTVTGGRPLLTFICGGCKGTVEAGMNDVEVLTSCIRGETGESFFVQCPGCGHQNFPPRRDITEGARESARKRARESSS